MTEEHEQQEPDWDEKRMSFTEHLGELRTRIIHSVYALLAAAVVCYALYGTIFSLLQAPLTPMQEIGLVTEAPEDGEGGEDGTGSEAETQGPRVNAEWTVLNPLEPIIMRIKLAGYGGLLIALPFIMWQLCAFIFPGLRPEERRAAKILLFGCSLLAVAGVLVAYFGVFPLVMPYLMNFVPDGVNVQLRMNETVSIVLKGLVGFAVAFQFPMVVLVLVYMGLLTPQTLKEYRKIAIVGMAAVSAMLTPPDPVSLVIMLIPLALLYESSIWLAQLMVWRRNKEPEA